MKIWTSEHVFAHNWESVVRGQWQKYPNPHNNAVLGIDVLERAVDPKTGVLSTHRVIASDWGLANWVQRLIGADRTCFAHEYSTVDAKKKLMTLDSVNLTFCNFVSMRERMSYAPHPEDPANKTVMRQEMVVTVQGVPLTSYMESIILSTVSAKSGQGRSAIDWIVGKIVSEETRSKLSLSATLEGFKTEMADLRHAVEDKIIGAAKKSIDELQRDLAKIPTPMMLKAEEQQNGERKKSL